MQITKQIENNFLFKEKEREKGEIIARQEVISFNESQRQFRKLWNENEINKKTIEKLEKDNQKLKDEIFKLKFRLDKQPKKVETTLTNVSETHINRILHHMKIGVPYWKRELSSELCMSITILNNALNFMEKMKLIKIELTQDKRIKRI